jgi:hypothetical protein
MMKRTMITVLVALSLLAVLFAGATAANGGTMTIVGYGNSWHEVARSNN